MAKQPGPKPQKMPKSKPTKTVAPKGPSKMPRTPKQMPVPMPKAK